MNSPIRCPLIWGGTINSSIVAEGYDRLKQHFGVREKNIALNLMMRVVHVNENILKALDIDTRTVTMWAPRDGQGDTLYADAYKDMWGAERVRPEGGFYFDQRRFPLSGEISPSDIEKYPWPDPDAPIHTKGLRDEVRWVRENTDCAVVLYVPPPFIHLSQFLRGFQDWYLDFVLNTKIFDMLSDAVLERTMRMAKNVLQEVGQEVDVVLCCDDLGAQNGLQISRDHYLKYVKPRHAKYFRQIHDLSPAKLLFHCCGSVAGIIEDLIETGVDALNPVQVSTAGMNPKALKEKYQGRMAFWGGIDSQQVLPMGSVKDVKSAVEKTIEQMGEGGGYILSAVHNIQPDVPLENILAMFQHAREYVPSFAKA